VGKGREGQKRHPRMILAAVKQRVGEKGSGKAEKLLGDKFQFKGPNPIAD